MADPAGESADGALRLDFDRRLMLRFRGAAITSDAGLLAYRELDGALGLTSAAGASLADARTGKNGRHALVGLLRQAVYGRLAGYEDVNDAERLRRDPAMRWVVGERAVREAAASASQMGRFETEWLTRPENLAALADLPGRWIDTESSAPRSPGGPKRPSANPTYPSSTTTSTSTVMPNGRLPTPIAERACFSPNTSTKRSEQPFTTFECSV
jgi:hypothetical protein